MTSQDFWVIVPACNEEQHIQNVLSRIKEITKNIVLVDDGSKDKTYELGKSLNVISLKHVLNLGKGAALKTGCEFALQEGAKKMIVIDSDGQHNPEDIPKFVKALDDNEIVFGYRVKRESMPFILRFGNWGLNTLSYILFGIKLNDTQCGFRAFTSDAYKKVKWETADYFMESEMVALTGKHKLKYDQIPIDTVYSNRYKGTTVIDGLKIIVKMLFWRLTK